MADTVNSQTLIDGARNVVMKFTNVSDGTGESAVDKVIPASLSGTPGSVKIMRVKYSTTGMGLNILWDATTDLLALAIPQDRSDDLDFSKEGGLINNAGSGKTGKIQFTTVGHTAGDTYMVELHMVKKA